MIRRKDQQVVTKQLYEYLLLQASSPLDGMVSNVDSWRWRGLVEGGHCFGFSVCRAVMRISGKLQWWNSAIDAVVIWNGTQSWLNQPVLLPGSTQKIHVSIRSIFERLTHYLVYSQDNEFVFSQWRCHEFLLPEADFLFLDAQGVQKKIQENYRIAGHFSLENFAYSLQDMGTIEAIKNNICLIYTIEHCCELSHDGKGWHIYDPNYEDGQSKFFEDVSALYVEIQRILGQDFCIELACIEPLQVKPFSYYYNIILKDPAQELMQDRGWLQILNSVGEEMSEQLAKYFENDRSVRANFQYIDHVGNSILMRVCLKNQTALARVLLNAGAAPDFINSGGWTPLCTAVWSKNIDLVRLLINSGANPFLSKGLPCTIFQYAAYFGQTEILKILLNRVAFLGINHAMLDDLSLFAQEQNHTETLAFLERYRLLFPQKEVNILQVNHSTLFASQDKKRKHATDLDEHPSKRIKKNPS